MKSIWNEDAGRVKFSPMEGDIKTDVLIIGGGMAGLLCAYMLKKKGIDCVVVEAGEILCGITKNTTAKITIQHGIIYDRIIRTYGIEAARGYLNASLSALEEFKKLCKNTDCDFEERDAYVFSRTEEGRERIEKELLAMHRIGYPADFLEKTPLPFDVKGAIRVRRQAQFHPLKFAYKLARDLCVYENTKVLELTPDGVITNRGKIKSKETIVATHFPFLNKHGSYFLKMYQERSYVLALEGAEDVNGMYIDESGKGLSFRNYKGLLLLGGGAHRTGKNSTGWRVLDDFAKRFYPKAKAVARWATQDCMTLDGIPYIGKYSGRTENLYVATGFNKWGMTSSMVSAMILSDKICGKENEYADVFSPSRSIIHPQLAVNAAEALMGFLNPFAPRCPHLGCSLKYNRAERSWDCPCHGSRFTEDGELIDNPATDDKRAGI